MTFLIFALSQNGANPTFINDRLQTAYVFIIIMNKNVSNNLTILQKNVKFN
jgi:hypothetical protein